MDLLSPLSRLLGISQLLPPSSSARNLEPKNLGSKNLEPSKLEQGVARTTGSRAGSAAAAPNIVTHTTRASSNEQRLLAQLRSLSPQALQRFVAQSLPFLADKRFAISLARAIASTQQPSFPHSTRHSIAQTTTATATLSNKLATNALPANKLNLARSPPPATPKIGEKIGESYQLRDNSGVIWRVWLLPLALDGRLERIAIYYAQRREKKSDRDSRDSNKRRGRNSSRLVFAIELAHTGPLEIEAEHNEGTLRVALRATTTFSKVAQLGIRERFLEILDDLSLRGQIVFYRVDSLPMGSLSASEESTL